MIIYSEIEENLTCMRVVALYINSRFQNRYITIFHAT